MNNSSNTPFSAPPATASGLPVAVPRDTGETDFDTPVIFHAAGAKRFVLPLVEVGIAACLTLVFVVRGGLASFRDGSGIVASSGAIVFLLLVWGAAIFHLCGVWRYRVVLDEPGITLQNGFLRREVRWDEMFIAQWQAHRTGNEDGEINTSWKMEIRDAAGTVLMNLNGDLLEPEDRRLLTRLITVRIEQERLQWLQREGDE